MLHSVTGESVNCGPCALSAGPDGGHVMPTTGAYLWAWLRLEYSDRTPRLAMTGSGLVWYRRRGRGTHG